MDEDAGLVHRVFVSGTWSEPESLGGTLASAPAVTAWAVDQLQVFAIFPDGELWNRYWDGEVVAPVGVAGRRADRDARGVVVERRPDRRLGARSRRRRLASLVGRHALGRLGAAVTRRSAHRRAAVGLLLIAAGVAGCSSGTSGILSPEGCTDKTMVNAELHVDTSDDRYI